MHDNAVEDDIADIAPRFKTSMAKSTSLRRRLVRWLIAAGILVVAACAYLGVVGAFGNNLRVVTPGRYYRSGRMSGDELRRTIAEHGIRRVVNLCGETEGDWYAEEIAACRALSVVHDDIRVASTSLPDAEAIQELIHVFHNGPYPLLVHCGGGVDRAGFAAALYQVVVESRDPVAAVDEQLSWRTGHWPVGGHEQLDRFFELYGATPRTVDFRTWALFDYPRERGR